jgi:phage terminase large subunit-like protein
MTGNSNEISADWSKVPLADLKKLRDGLKATVKLQNSGKMFVFDPYPSQRRFCNLGREIKEALLRAGNQRGKTITAAYKTACHLTGIYPDWWEGVRFTKATRGWVAGAGGVLVRDGPQEKLCGRSRGGEATLGTGMIPRDLFEGKPSLGHGVTGLYDTIFVKHVAGGISSATFKSYDQGVEKFQSEPLDWIWLDEEPPMDVYEECVTRTTATQGVVYVSLTPRRGWTPLLKRFLREKTPSRVDIHMLHDEAKHITAEMHAVMLQSWQAHERAARSDGIPTLGSNAVFEDVAEESLAVPLVLNGADVLHMGNVVRTEHWYKLWAVDFGIGHPFAAVLLAWDKDYDVIYVLGGFRMTGALPKAHADRMRSIAAGVRVAWPHDGTQRDKGSGEPLAAIYGREKLPMLPDHATFADGGYSTEAGIMEMLVRMRSGRFQVAAGFGDWWDEFRSYYREDGIIKKVDDDLMSATRIGVMQIRSARQGAIGYRPQSAIAAERTHSVMPAGHDYDLWSV